jgi:hypothetical protein
MFDRGLDGEFANFLLAGDALFFQTLYTVDLAAAFFTAAHRWRSEFMFDAIPLWVRLLVCFMGGDAAAAVVARPAAGL